MDIRYSANQRDVKRYTTEELRDEFLIQDLYHPDEVGIRILPRGPHGDIGMYAGERTCLH